MLLAEMHFKSSVPSIWLWDSGAGTHKPRCVKFDFGEERTTNSGSLYWNIECRYRDFDGKEFGDVPTDPNVPLSGTSVLSALVI